MKDFEWFLTLLTQLELQESREHAFDRFLDMHLFITTAKSKTDMKGIGLQMALELIHQEEQKDLLTGLRTRTQPGRPNWDQVSKNPKKVTDIHLRSKFHLNKLVLELHVFCQLSSH